MTIAFTFAGAIALAITIAAGCSPYIARHIATALLAWGNTLEEAREFLGKDYRRLHGRIVAPGKEVENA